MLSEYRVTRYSLKDKKMKTHGQHQAAQLAQEQGGQQLSGGTLEQLVSWVSSSPTNMGLFVAAVAIGLMVLNYIGGFILAGTARTNPDAITNSGAYYSLKLAAFAAFIYLPIFFFTPATEEAKAAVIQILGL